MNRKIAGRSDSGWRRRWRWPEMASRRRRRLIAIAVPIASWGGWLLFLAYVYSCYPVRLSVLLRYMPEYVASEWFLLVLEKTRFAGWLWWNGICLAASVGAAWSISRISWKLALLDLVFPAYVAVGLLFLDCPG